MATNIIFLNSVGPETSARSKEIVKSEVRSHAARISHQRLEQNDWNSSATSDASSGALPQPVTFEVKSWRHAPMRRAYFKTKCSRQKGASASKSKSECESEGAYDECPDRSAAWNNSQRQLAGGAKSRHGISIPLDLQWKDIDHIHAKYWKISSLCSAQFCSILGVKNIFTDDWLRHMQDEAFYHVAAAFVKSEYRELQPPDCVVDREILVHKMTALKLIHERLARSDTYAFIDNTTLLAILFLPFVEDLVVDQTEAVIHWGAAARILEARGGLLALESSPDGAYTANVFDQVRGFCMAHNKIDVLEEDFYAGNAPSPSYSVSPTSSWCSLAISSDLPIGLDALAMRELIGERTLDLAQITANSSQLSKEAAEDYVAGKQPELEGLTSNWQATWNLLNVVPSTVIGEPSIELVMCVAMMVYITRNMGPLRMVNIIARAARSRLTLALYQCATPRDEAQEEALFWASAVAIESWTTRLGELGDNGRALRDYQSVRYPEFMSREVSTIVLGKFFYDDALLADQDRFMREAWL